VIGTPAVNGWAVTFGTWRSGLHGRAAAPPSPLLDVSKLPNVTFQPSTASAPTWLAVWLSGNALASINVVALRQTPLVWVTVCGRVNHLGM